MAVVSIYLHYRLAPAATASATNPYLQSMYAAAAAASNPYAGLQGTGLISLAQNPAALQAGQLSAGSTGNPLLDAYGQYAALAAATGVYSTTANQATLTNSAIDAQASKLIFIFWIL